MRQRNSKYNAKKSEYKGIKFDSKAEMEYYKHLELLKEMGEVSWFDMQPEFTLLGGFTDNFGRKHLPIKYRADFLVHYTDAPPVVIDIKGMETPDFKLKRKMYCARFPLELKLIAYSKIDGGWIETDELKKARKLRKKAKEAKLNG